MTLKQLIRRNGEVKYRVCKTPTTNKKRWGIQMLDAEGNPNVDVTIFTVANMPKEDIKPTSNVIKVEVKEKTFVWILTNKTGLEWDEAIDPDLVKG